MKQIAQIIKENPFLAVQIISYAQTQKQITLAKVKLNAIEKYLVNNQGIGKDRLRKKIDNSFTTTIIDFKSIDPSEEK